MKPEYYLVFALFGLLGGLGVLSFFVAPVYAAGVSLVLDVLKYAAVSIISFLFGRSMPEQPSDPKPGRSSQTESTTKIETAAPPPTTP